jgi:hypothetical protein
MDWYMNWLSATATGCMMPLVVLGAVFGVGSSDLAMSIQNMVHPPDSGIKGFELYYGVVYGLLLLIMSCMMYGLWPVLCLFWYGGMILAFNEGQAGNIMMLGVFGFVAGLWTASKLLPKIDELLGIPPNYGISSVVFVFGLVGQAYMAVKTVEAGRTIIHKI